MKLHDFDDNTVYPQFKNKKIKIASFLVELGNRKPIQIIREFYNYYEFDKRGKLDKDKYYEQLRIKLNTVDFGLNENQNRSNIIDASKTFYQKRVEHEYEWFPTDILKSKLHQEIFK